MWDAWEALFMEIVGKHARLKQSGSQKNILRGLRWQTKLLKKKAIIENNAVSWEQYKQARNAMKLTMLSNQPNVCIFCIT